VSDAQELASIDEEIAVCSLDRESSKLSTIRWFDSPSGLMKCQKMDNRLYQTVRNCLRFSFRRERCET